MGHALRHIDIHLALGRGGIGNRRARRPGWPPSGSAARRRRLVPSFLAAAVIAANTDYVAGLPRRIAEALAPVLPLVPLALQGPPMAFSIDLVWHERTHLDAGARAFRELVIAALAPPRRGEQASRARA